MKNKTLTAKRILFLLFATILFWPCLSQTRATKTISIRRSGISDKVYQPTEGTNSSSGAGSQPAPPPDTNPATNNVPPTLQQDTTATNGHTPTSSTPGGNPKERQGPANVTFNLAAQVDADFEFSTRDLLSTFNTIYRDANIRSGYYYFLPAAYNLSWIANTGEYEFNATYSAATASGRGETTVTAILRPRLATNEIKFIQDLLKKNIKGKPEEAHGITDLIAVPMAQAPEISFSNLGQFGVESKSISIRAPSDLMDAIYISFTTNRIDDLMGMFFNNIGLYGDVIVYPAGEGMPGSIRIPFNLKIDDPGTFGKFELQPASWRSGWQNKTDYPVILTRFNVMKKHTNGDVRVYTWQMGDREVPEHAKVKFDATLVPAWIDTNSEIVKMWMDYTVKPCISCNSTVKEKIIKGTSGSRVNNIEVTILTPLNFTKAELIKIKIRSFQADPNGLAKVNLPTITVNKDGTTFPGGQIFIPEGASPDFEYLVQVYMSDGTKYESDTWYKSSDLELVIGTNQIKEQVSHFK
jgi:hypothetical protein